MVVRVVLFVLTVVVKRALGRVLAPVPTLAMKLAGLVGFAGVVLVVSLSERYEALRYRLRSSR